MTKQEDVRRVVATTVEKLGPPSILVNNANIRSFRALMDLTVAYELPVGNGILPVENEEQAVVRADPAQGDKGGDAARAALALHSLKQQFGAR